MAEGCGIMEVKRLLCIVGGMNVGGAETFLMKLYRKIDKSKYQMDFAVAIEGNGYYDDEILSMGGKIFHITPKSKGFFKNFTSIVKLVRKEKYKYVLRVSQHSMSALELLAAKLGGAKVCAFRSSNSNTTTGGGKDLKLHKMCKFMPRLFANVKIAPSTEAALHAFGKKHVEKGNVIYLNNGIDVDKYTYNLAKREQLRQELGLKEKFVVGHIGRFSYQKNHKFLIEIFEKIIEKKENSHLVCVGVGELQDEIKSIIKSKGLENNVSFLGTRSDVPNLLSAFDVLLFPSFFEGMPNVVIESQASGLHCIISDNITKEANITGLVEYLSLNKSAEEWAKNCLIYSDEYDRQSYKDVYDKYGYDITTVVGKFISAVFEGSRK